MPLFRRGQPPEALAAAMAGVKLGDRVIFAGTDDVRLAAALASTAGLSGRLELIAPDAAAAARRGAAIERAGALAEPRAAPLDALSGDEASFDVAVAEDVLIALDAEARRRALAGMFRVLRPGGRLLWIERGARGALFVRSAPDTASWEAMLTAAGFRGVRTLAAAAGQVFVEGIKSSNS